MRLLIDLGAKADLLVAEPFVKAHQLLTRMGPTLTEPLGAGVGGETRYAFARLAGLQAGDGLAATDLIAGLSVNGTLRGGDYDALLGAGFLQRYRVIVDYPHQVMILEPRAPAPAERFDRSGVFPRRARRRARTLRRPPGGRRVAGGSARASEAATSSRPWMAERREA